MKFVILYIIIYIYRVTYLKFIEEENFQVGQITIDRLLFIYFSRL